MFNIISLAAQIPHATMLLLMRQHLRGLPKAFPTLRTGEGLRPGVDIGVLGEILLSGERLGALGTSEKFDA